MLDGRVLGASQVEYKPFGKPPLAAGFSGSHTCTRRKAAKKVISLSSCGGSNNRESEKARKRELGSFFSGSDSLRPAAAQPQRQCRSGPQRRGPYEELITRSKGAEHVLVGLLVGDEVNGSVAGQVPQHGVPGGPGQRDVVDGVEP